MLMPVRLVLGTVAWWEIVATTALMLVAIFACAWFAAPVSLWHPDVWATTWSETTGETGTDEIEAEVFFAKLRKEIAP